MPTLGSTELIILLIVVLVVFGAKRLPDSARSLGRSMRILKAETKGMRDDSDPDRHDTTVTAQPLPPVPPTPAPSPQPEAPVTGAAQGEQHPQQPRP